MGQNHYRVPHDAIVLDETLGTADKVLLLYFSRSVQSLPASSFILLVGEEEPGEIFDIALDADGARRLTFEGHGPRGDELEGLLRGERDA